MNIFHSNKLVAVSFFTLTGLLFGFSFAHAEEITAFPQRISVATDGTPSNGPSYQPLISGDGRFVIFDSYATNLISGTTTNPAISIPYRHDNQTGSTTPVSVSIDGIPMSGAGSAISKNGRFVAFHSYAKNIVANDTTGIYVANAFVRDMQTGITTRVSVSSEGTQENSDSYPVAVSNDGRFVLFDSYANNLVQGDTNGMPDVFLRDTQNGITTRISVSSNGAQSDGRSAGLGNFSDDVRFIVFESEGNNLVPGDTGGRDVFLRDMLTGSTTLVSTNSDGVQASGRTGCTCREGYPEISGNGRFVVFQSGATNLVPGDTNGIIDIFVKDLQTGSTTRESITSSGSQQETTDPNFVGAVYPHISDDGRFVVFTSDASNLVEGDTNGTYDAFLHDRETGMTYRIGSNNEATDHSDISGDGRVLTYVSPNNIFVKLNPALVGISTNHAPVLTPIGNQSVTEGGALTFTLSATDPDGDSLNYSAANLPSGATFDPQTHVFSWTPSYSQAGNYPDVEFTVTDNGSPMELAMELITITVGNVNRAPVFTPVGTQEVLENTALSFAVAATDPDSDAVILAATNTPTGATFNQSTGVFSWIPSLTQAGVYVVTFVATDNGMPIEQATLDVVITVGDNPTPVEQSVALVNTVVNYALPTNVENSYLANLKKVEKFIEDGKVASAINQLNAFISKVENDYNNGVITQAERDYLVGVAQQLIAVLSGV